MIISHEYKFIFIKTRKTAGTSIEIFLSQLCKDDDVVTPIYPHVEPHRARNFRGLWNPLPELLSGGSREAVNTARDLVLLRKYYNHMPALLVRHRIKKDVWDSYFKFCVERNPWDKTLSDYYMNKDRSGGILSLDDYFRRGQFCVDYPLYTDRKGNPIVDRIIKYESLMSELGTVFSHLGIPFNNSLEVRAKSEHRKNKTPYQEVFSDSQRDIIEKVYAKEIAMHSYSFQDRS